MAKMQQTVYLLTDRQRDALVNYLQNQPYREVALAIQMLSNAPSASVNVDAPEDSLTSPNISSGSLGSGNESTNEPALAK